MKNFRSWIILAVVAGVIGSLAYQLSGVAADPAKSAESEAKPFPLPEDADADQLLESLDEVLKTERNFTSDQEEEEFESRKSLTMIEIGKRLLADKKLSDEYTKKGAFLQVQGLLNLAVLADFQPAECQQAIAAVNKLLDDPRPAVAEFAKRNQFPVRINCLTALSQKERDQLVDDVMGEITDEKFSRSAMQLAQMLGGKFERTGDEEHQIAFFKRLAAAMRDTGKESLAAEAAFLEGQLRQMKLLGNTLDLKGTTFEGKKFDWDDYKGKVVLVDFWATYCGPCRAEMPNILKNYRKYHDKGFEVVGINMDSDAEQAKEFLNEKKFPWVNLVDFDQDEDSLGHPMAVYYGVTKLPTTILVGKDGKVVSLSVRGPELAKLLKKLLVEQE